MSPFAALDHDEGEGTAHALINLEAEQSLLGAVLFDNAALALAPDALAAEHFGEPFHQRFFEVAADRIRKGRAAEPTVLYEHFKTDQALKELGGLRYLADLMDKAPPNHAVAAYGELLIDLAVRRRLVDYARGLIDQAMGGGPDTAADIANAAEQDINTIARGVEPSDANLIDARSSVEETLGEIESEVEHGKPKGKMTGLRCFDRRLRGLRPGHLIVIGGRPGMAKTGLARVAATGCAARNPHDLVAFFALEMDRRELDERALAELSFYAGDGVPYQDMASGKLDPLTLRRLREQAWKIPKNLIIDDASSLTVEHIKRRVWALKRRGNLVAAFIDYLQIMDLPPRQGRNDAALIGEVTKALKNLARKAEIAIVLLSQINRGVEGRDDKRPQLSDLRESGAIEQDANAVLFPFREFYYVERAEPKEGGSDHLQWEQECELLRRRMDVICAKNRGGAVGMDRQEYFAEFDAIRDTQEERP
jgi:replicative DNA helicase